MERVCGRRSMAINRHKLTELIWEADLKCNSTMCEECDWLKMKKCKAAMIATHLIKNGVEMQKYGHWIIKSSGHGRNATNWAECSECLVCGSPQWKVCPVCETKMNPVQFPVNDFDPDDFMGEYEEEND